MLNLSNSIDHETLANEFGQFIEDVNNFAVKYKGNKVAEAALLSFLRDECSHYTEETSICLLCEKEVMSDEL
jgi:hypothetical protein